MSLYVSSTYMRKHKCTWIVHIGNSVSRAVERRHYCTNGKLYQSVVQGIMQMTNDGGYLLNKCARLLALLQHS
jgi:hypothetical protein